MKTVIVSILFLFALVVSPVRATSPLPAFAEALRALDHEEAIFWNPATGEEVAHFIGGAESVRIPTANYKRLWKMAVIHNHPAGSADLSSDDILVAWFFEVESSTVVTPTTTCTLSRPGFIRFSMPRNVGDRTAWVDVRQYARDNGYRYECKAVRQ